EIAAATMTEPSVLGGGEPPVGQARSPAARSHEARGAGADVQLGLPVGNRAQDHVAQSEANFSALRRRSPHPRTPALATESATLGRGTPQEPPGARRLSDDHVVAVSIGPVGR